MFLTRLLLTAVAFLALSFPSVATPEPVKPNFNDTLSRATLAVYQGEQKCDWEKVDTYFGPMSAWGCHFVRHFTCTATVIGRSSETEYVGLSAGHCINWDKEKNYYVSETIDDEPVLHNIQIIKSENDNRYDFVVFTFRSAKELPIVNLNHPDAGQPLVGTAVLNTNFALGIGKEHLEGKVVSEQLSETRLGMKTRYLVSIGVGPGASGSPVVDAQTHEIVGLVEAVFPGTQMSTVVIPTGRQLFDFMEDDSAGLKPMPEPEAPKSALPPGLSGLTKLWATLKNIVAHIFKK